MIDRQVTGLAIRMATPDDAAILSDLVSQLADYERLGHLNRMSPEIMRAELERSDRVLEACLATLNDEPVGMATWFHTYSTFAAKRGLYLEDLYVRADRRQQGIGTGLLRWVARLAVDRDCGRMEWNTLLWNTPSIEFYEAMGAQPNDAWTTYRLIGDGLRRLAGAS